MAPEKEHAAKAGKKADPKKPKAHAEKAAPKPTRAHAGKGAKADAPAVRVRMYRHGLGDCFLLSFPRDGARDFRVLIDCGVIQGTPAVKDEAKDSLLRVIEDLAEITKDPDTGRPTVDVLVATHEHWDHLAGFAVYTEQFDEFDFGEVWLAWTEDPKNPVATKLRRERAEKVNALKIGLDHARNQLGAGATEEARDGLERVGEVLSFFGVDPHSGEGLGTTDDGDALFGVKGKPRLTVGEAMDWCRHHKSKNVRFWAPGALIDLTDTIPGLRVYVLGPPTDLAQLYKDLPTKKGKETYEEEHEMAAVSRAFFGADVGTGDPRQAERKFVRSAPFDPKYRVEVADATRTDFYRTYYFGTGCGTSEDWRRIDEAGIAGASAYALQLDSDTNNTSLALAFELNDNRVLLFPGDAQVGNWESWHADADGTERSWKVPAGAGAPERAVTAKDLLGRTVVYKVGHHGSHNATLRGKGLELMTHPDLVALVPVDVYVAHEKKHWERMPFEPLMDALRRHTFGRLIIADQPLPTLKPKVPFPGKVEDAKDTFAVITYSDSGDDTRVATRPLWVEYSLPGADG